MSRIFNINTNIPMASNDTPGKMSVEHYNLMVNLPSVLNNIDAQMISKATTMDIEQIRTLIGQIQTGYLKKVIVESEPTEPIDNVVYYQSTGDGKYVTYSYIDGVKIELGDTEVDTSDLATKEDIELIQNLISEINDKIDNMPVKSNVVLAGSKTW